MKQQAKTPPKRLIPKCSMGLVYSPTFTTQVKPFMWGFPKMVGFPNTYWFSYKKWPTLGCFFWGKPTILGNPPCYGKCTRLAQSHFRAFGIDGFHQVYWCGNFLGSKMFQGYGTWGFFRYFWSPTKTRKNNTPDLKQQDSAGRYIFGCLGNCGMLLWVST